MKQKIIKYGLGIDISKDDFHVCLMGILPDGSTSILGRRKFSQTPGGFSKLTAWLKKHGLCTKSPLQIVMEATGVYHEFLLFTLHDQGFAPCLILAKQAKDYGKSLNSFSKNDQKDSEVLAHLASHRKLDPWKPFSEQIYQLRSLMRHRRVLIQERVVFQNRLHALKYAQVPSEPVLASTKALIDTFTKQIKAAEKKATALAKADKPFWKKIQKIVSSLPGIGLITMLEVISETNGFAQFTSIGQLICYAGYDIIENQSGKHTGKTKISKRGNARIRAAMYMPALSVIRNKVQPFYNLFERVLKRSGFLKKKAQVAVQRKLLIYIYVLWKNDEEFDPQKVSQANKSEEINTELKPQKQKLLSAPVEKKDPNNRQKEPHSLEVTKRKTQQKRKSSRTNLLHNISPEKASSSDTLPELHGIVRAETLTS